jgi:YbbR domain-containing protein
MENNPRNFTRSLLNNKKVLMVLSLVLAIFIWIGFTMNESEDTTRIIEGVPVTIDSNIGSQAGLEAFGTEGLTADVKVTGKRYLIGQNVLSADDIEVKATTSQVELPGSYTLYLSVSSKKDNANYTLELSSQNYVSVYYDRPVTQTVPLTVSLKSESSNLVSSEYTTSDPILNMDSITLTGPSNQMDELKTVYAVASTEGNLKKTTVLNANIKAVNEDGVQLKYITAENADKVTITVPVYTVEELPLTVDVDNLPSGMKVSDLDIEISPSTVQVAIDVNEAKNLAAITLGTLDYETLKEGENTFTFKSEDITEGQPQEQDKTYTVTVRLPESS